MRFWWLYLCWGLLFCLINIGFGEFFIFGVYNNFESSVQAFFSSGADNKFYFITLFNLVVAPLIVVAYLAICQAPLIYCGFYREATFMSVMILFSTLWDYYLYAVIDSPLGEGWFVVLQLIPIIYISKNYCRRRVVVLESRGFYRREK